MNRLVKDFICLLILCLPGLAFSETNNLLNEHAPEWKLTETDNNIQIFTRDYKESNFRAFKAVTVLDQSIESVLALISDPTSCPLWVDNCIESYNFIPHDFVHTENQFIDRYGYALSHLPWPFKNRDLIVHIITSNKPDSQEFMISMSSDKQLVSDNKNAVHITDTQTRYILRTLDKQKIEFIWMQHTEPNGKLPAWLVNNMIINLPLKSIEALKKVAKQDKYQNAVIEFDSQNRIQGIKFPDEN